MNNDFSMQSVKTLLRLDLKSRFGTTRKISVKQRLMQSANYLFTLGIYAVLLWGIYYLTKMFVDGTGMRYEFLVMVTCGTMLLVTVISIGNVVKNLYMNGDNELLLRFPVSGKEIFIAKSAYCFLHNAVMCVLIMLPFYIIFGAITNAGAGYYFASIAVILIATLLPFFVANILAVPVMLLMNFIKNKYLLVLIITIALLCGAFVFYMEALGNVLEYLNRENQNLFSADMIARYQSFAAAAYPFRFYADMLAGAVGAASASQAGLGFLYALLITAGLGALSLFVSTKVYYKTILNGIENAKASFTRKTKMVQRTVFGTLLRREFLLIFRSFNYSFQYLALAVAAPVMVYYCNRLASTMGTQSIGAKIVPGLTLLVIVIFIAIIVSFASTTISREGNEFYLTKVVPVSYTVQVATKFFLYAIVATASVIVCCLVCGLAFGSDKAGNLLSVTDIFAIFGISEMVVISLTCLSVWADVKSPTFNVSGDGELVAANKNVAVSLLVGILVAVAYGIFSMVFSFIPFEIGAWEVVRDKHNMSDIYSVLSVISALIMAISFCVLFVNLGRRYKKIVQ